MSNYVMRVDFFGTKVRCETDGNLICLNDLLIAGNNWRASNNLPVKNLFDLVSTKSYAEFKRAVAKRLNVDEDGLVKAIKGRNGRTMAHVILAIYIAEQLSPEFHVAVIQTFIEGKLLEFRELGGTEFKNLNAAIDLYLPDRLGKDNKGVYIHVAKAIRAKLLGDDSSADGWNEADVAQIHSRYEIESNLCMMLRLGVVKDYEHLKDLIERA